MDHCLLLKMEKSEMEVFVEARISDRGSNIYLACLLTYTEQSNPLVPAYKGVLTLNWSRPNTSNVYTQETKTDLCSRE